MLQIFEKYGKVGKVTILKDQVTRESKGVAFVLFVDRSAAHRAVQALNKKELFDRTLKVCIARDNGRAKEFIKRKVYKDKSRCYECGESGHLSYECPKNTLGDREKPVKKTKDKKSSVGAEGGEEGEGEVEEDFTLGDAIRYVIISQKLHQVIVWHVQPQIENTLDFKSLDTQISASKVSCTNQICADIISFKPD